MEAILRRELSAYFSSPIGYIYLAVFYIFAGFYFFAATLMSNSSDMTGVFQNLFTIVMFLVPVLTMRLMSEDKKNKTDQVLLTAPVSLFAITMGKFLAAVILFALSILVTLVFAVVIAMFVVPEWSVIFGNFLGIFLLGSALISIGMFISALTENQVIAAVGGFAAGLILILVDSIASLIPVPLISSILTSISFFKNYSDFTVGVLNISSVVFFISVCVVFVFLTIRTLEKKRWS